MPINFRLQVRTNAAFDPARLTAFVADISEEGGGALAAHVPLRSIAVCTLVFVLSAVAPALFLQVRRR